MGSEGAARGRGGGDPENAARGVGDELRRGAAEDMIERIILVAAKLHYCVGEGVVSGRALIRIATHKAGGRDVAVGGRQGN